MSESFMDFENEIDLSSTRITTHDNASFKINEPTTRITHEEFDFATPIQSVTSKTISVDPEMYKYTYPSQVMNLYDRDTWTVSADHCYARPWNWRPESNFLRPTKTLFVPKSITNKRKSTNPLAPLQDSEDIIDVESGSDEPTPIYDVSKANHLMEECDRYAALVRGDRENDDWEDKISKVNWTPTQYRLFNVTVGILNNFHLSRLSQKGIHNEPLLRRSIIDKSVERIRRLLATVSWDTKLTQWLHHLLVENLSTDYLSAYLDILQTLKAKLPTFVDKMMYGPTSSKHGLLNNENLFSLLKRQWDPVASSLMQDKPKKLPGNPVIIIVPSAPTTSKRIHKWITLLSNLATVVTIPTNFAGVDWIVKSTQCQQRGMKHNGDFVHYKV